MGGVDGYNDRACNGSMPGLRYGGLVDADRRSGPDQFVGRAGLSRQKFIGADGGWRDAPPGERRIADRSLVENRNTLWLNDSAAPQRPKSFSIEPATLSDQVGAAPPRRTASGALTKNPAGTETDRTFVVWTTWRAAASCSRSKSFCAKLRISAEIRYAGLR